MCFPEFGDERYAIQKIKRACMVVCNQVHATGGMWEGSSG